MYCTQQTMPDKQKFKQEHSEVMWYFHQHGIVKGTIKYLKDKKGE